MCAANARSPRGRSSRTPQEKLPTTIVELVGYAIKRLFDLISEVVGDSKKVLHASLLLVAVSFPIGAVFFYLHLDPKRWRWVLVSFGVTDRRRQLPKAPRK